MTQTYGLTVAGAAESYRMEAKSLNRDLLSHVNFTKIRSWNANDAVDKLVELFTNS